MSGQGVRFQQRGYRLPKPMIPVGGVPMIERLLGNLPCYWRATFVLAENHQESDLPAKLLELRPTGQIIYIPPHSKGPGFAVQAALALLEPNDPVFVSYCDYGMVWDSTQFERFVIDSECDACVVSYRGFHAHYLSPQMYAYSRMHDERVAEVREKGCFTANREAEFASSGAYYFKSARCLANALKGQVELGLALNGEYYLSLTVEAMLRLNPKAHVRVFEIEKFFQWGTPEDLANFNYWETAFKAWNREQSNVAETSQILMPMAGSGSRFSELTRTPKPFIEVSGKPMFESALRSLPHAEHTVFVALEAHKSHLERRLKGRHAEVVWIHETPSGQALSTECGISSLRPEQDVIVSACDHEIVLSADVWTKFRTDPKCEAAIFTVRGFPGARRSPHSYAYVVVMNDDQLFPAVKSVSVKTPVSEDPAQDALLVGTFWFASPALLKEGINLVRSADRRVNGEYYLDSVFELLLQAGRVVRTIPLDGYICRGDPDALAESLYYEEIFAGRKTNIASMRIGTKSCGRI